MERLMKVKMYRFIFSILFIAVCFISKGQTVDGKLYTIFNNWYQWSGGKFNTNLNIPKVIATTGRDTGGIRYSLSDSSMYIWTGSQWRAVGSAIDTTSLSNRINLRVKYSDTASMLGPYLRKIDTLTLSNRINLKQNLITLSTTGTTGAATFNQSTGALNIPNYSTDTSSLSNRIDARVKYSDTASMISPYARTNVVNAGLATKLNISDTASMLSPYLRSINLPNTDTAIVVKAYVTNSELFTITKGQVVYIFGAQGDRASVKLAKNTSDTFSSKTLGIVRADIASGQAGWITTQGQVSGINLGAYTAGDILWLDSIAGGFTKNKPEAPYHSVFLGVVERANAGNGLIYVKPQNGVELDELHNVKITSPSNNQILAYTISPGIWQNKSVITALGYTPLNVTDTASMLNGRLSGITLNTSSAIHTTPVTFSRVGGAWSGTLSLANQSGFTVFRRASGTGTPSFGTIDSSYFGGAFRSQVRANTNDYRRDIDTVPLAVFNVGSAAAGDTAAFSTSTLAGSFYLDGTDTMFITSYRVALQGTSASITPEVWFNDSLNVTAGGTRIATGSAITNLTTGTSVTATTNKIPPANFVFVRFSAVTTKPTYFTLTLFGYRIRKQ